MKAEQCMGKHDNKVWLRSALLVLAR